MLSVCQQWTVYLYRVQVWRPVQVYKLQELCLIVSRLTRISLFIDNIVFLLYTLYTMSLCAL